MKKNGNSNNRNIEFVVFNIISQKKSAYLTEFFSFLFSALFISNVKFTLLRIIVIFMTIFKSFPERYLQGVSQNKVFHSFQT